MIIVNLKGGLGNQMFQYALGRKLSLFSHQEFKFDLTGYERNNFRSYGLGIFNVLENFASHEEVRKIKYPYGLLSKGWRGFKSKILRIYSTGWKPKTIEKIEKKLATGKDIYLDGYWQSYKYFEDIKDVLIKDFSLKIKLEETHPELITKIASTNSVALSVRRTDYLWPKNLKSIGICSANYYKKAIKIIEAKVSDPFFFVITDDLEWTKANIPINCSVIYVSEMRKNNTITYYQEMMLMSKCQHHIIANSSFSWWPAWLGKDLDKIVIAPDKWFTDNSLKINDIVPSTWIKLPRD